MIRKEAPASSDGDTVCVTFELPATVWAGEVAVVGEFNGWDPAANRLAQGPDGTWRTAVRLGRHQRYRFGYLVDGREWLNDWSADEQMPGRSGATLSVIRT